jgi:4-hydroxy-3-methylbut-2-enyl diphosphate reductase
VVVVIGGAHSNNTRELVATCSRFCRVHHIEHAADLRAKWFDNAETVGLTAGTSTPDSVIDAVEQALARFRPLQQAA